MMTEKELIGKLQGLRQIKPRKDWVVLTKNQVLGETPGFTFFPYFKPAFASLVSIFVLIGLFGFAQNSVPGDFLYPIKKVTERSQAVFVSEEEKPQVSLELVNKRLEELTKIAEANQVKKIAPALDEFQASVSEAAKNLSRMDATSSDSVTIKRIVEETQKLDKNKQVVEEILATQIDTEELSSSYKGLAEDLIKFLETRTLTEEKETILDEMKELLDEGKYLDALILYFINQ